MRMFRLVCLSLCLLFASATFASAHRVNIFAYVDGGEIQVECGFNRSQKVRQRLSVWESRRPSGNP